VDVLVLGDNSLSGGGLGREGRRAGKKGRKGGQEEGGVGGGAGGGGVGGGGGGVEVGTGDICLMHCQSIKTGGEIQGLGGRGV